ncbi:hypothetical protein PITCH_A420064 [uncultured Desulfobacterium sp.]|uniref:Uncharacterized protein n=1 Tax=uncultured Desulfobacterium sp. TaxID=201089 RepID=A0A445N097_9BACT|nr:hypothetical protein PITCH_A420064 [uncultured Desulfobacterium sp.]
MQQEIIFVINPNQIEVYLIKGARSQNPESEMKGRRFDRYSTHCLISPYEYNSSES